MLDPNEASLRDIIRWATTPAQSGFYFSVSDLIRIGRAVAIPVRPMSRYAGFEQLVRGASIEGKVSEVFAAIRTEMESQIDVYRECDLVELDPWIEQARASLETWAEIERAWVEHEASPDE